MRIIKEEEQDNSDGEEDSTPDIPEEFILDPESCMVDPVFIVFFLFRQKY